MKKPALHWQILIALITGILFGFLARFLHFEWFVSHYISLAGTIFLRLLRMVIVPLIVASIISGVTSLDQSGGFGRMFTKTFTFYIFSSLAAILTGLFLVNLIQPGLNANFGFTQIPEGLEGSIENIGNTLLGIIPLNPFESMTRGEILPTIFFSLLFGFFILKTPKNYRLVLTDFFNAVFETMMKLTQFIILFTPVGVFALISKMIAQTGIDVFMPMLSYILTIISGLALHALLTLPLIIFLLGRINPLRQARAMSPALLTAFSTASSSATLPLTIQSVEAGAGVSNRVSSFVLPLGATINMDGTALYECVAAIFISQVYGIELSFTQQAIVVITALAASIGAAGIPMAGLVMMTIVLRSVGLPLEGIGLILAVDPFLDMLRTTVNVWSDSCCAVLIAKFEGEELRV